MIGDTDVLHARILIVDDQEVNINLLEQTLAEAGYDNVASTTRPRDVFALHREHRYDLILLDLQMPGMDGFQVMESLKAITGDGYLPVLVITAEPGHKLRALQAGAKDFISKPFDLLEVKTRIRNMLEVRLLYKQLDDHSRQLEKVVQEKNRRTACERSALSQPDRTGFRLVLGAGRERRFHQSLGARAGDAGNPG